MIFVNIHSDARYFNLGDSVSCPADYFEFENARKVAYQAQDEIEPGEPVVLGGGGLFMHNFAQSAHALATSRPVIVWGAGLNYAPGEPIPEDIYGLIKHSPLPGFRDRTLEERGAMWVPCASCMHPAFTRVGHITEPTSRFSIYSHGWSGPIVGNAPQMQNMDPSVEFEQVVFHLVAARTVVTNSYHGAYWAMLLGRRVILWFPDENPPGRFMSGLPQTAPIARSWAEVEWLAEQIPPVPPWLAVCRGINQATARRLQTLVNFASNTEKQPTN